MNSPDLYAFILRLQAHKPVDYRQFLGHHTQALFYELVRQVDPALSNTLHSNIQHKPFSVALHQENQREVGVQHQPNIVEVRISLCQNQLFSSFTRALLTQQSNQLQLGNHSLRLLEVLGTSDSHRLAGFSSFAQIVQQNQHKPPSKTLGLRFSSPCAFSQSTRANGKPRFAILPVPDLVFGSLARRWNELCPSQYQIDAEQLAAALDDTVVSIADIQTRQFYHQQGKAPQKGFVGECHYELPSQADLAQTISQLADAAFYLGLGIKTARGMGQTYRI